MVHFEKTILIIFEYLECSMESMKLFGKVYNLRLLLMPPLGVNFLFSKSSI